MNFHAEKMVKNYRLIAFCFVIIYSGIKIERYSMFFKINESFSDVTQ